MPLPALTRVDLELEVIMEAAIMEVVMEVAIVGVYFSRKLIFLNMARLELLPFCQGLLQGALPWKAM